MDEKIKKAIDERIASRKKEEEDAEAKIRAASEASRLDNDKFSALIQKIIWPAFDDFSQYLNSQGKKASVKKGTDFQLSASLIVERATLDVNKGDVGEIALSTPDGKSSPRHPKRIKYVDVTKELFEKEVLLFVNSAI